MLGYSLEYHATPQQILIGRLIIVGWLVLLVILWTIDRRLGILAALSAVFFVPWMISRGLKFAARHTSWRNVRFRFAGGGGGAFVAGFIQMLVTSFPWIQPLAWHRANHYLYDSLSWGPVCFKVHATVGKVFRVGLVSLAWMVGLLIGVLVVAFALTVLGMVFALIPKDGGQSEPLVMFISNVTIFIGAVIIVVNLACYRIRVFNAIRSSLTATWEPEKWIAGADYAAMHRRGAPAPGAVVAMVNSRMSPRHWVWIWTSNLVLTLLSFGLARPWCVIRMARFVYGNTELAISADLDDVVDSLAVEGSAAGSEFMDIEGLAIDFGF